MSAFRRPLPLVQDDWRKRWLVLPSWNVLHRVSEIEWDDEEDRVAGDGVTLCGRRGWLQVPGISSRMGRKRCGHCCDLLGIPRGDGAPYNQGIAEPGETIDEAVRSGRAGEEGQR